MEISPFSGSSLKNLKISQTKEAKQSTSCKSVNDLDILSEKSSFNDDRSLQLLVHGEVPLAKTNVDKLFSMSREHGSFERTEEESVQNQNSSDPTATPSSHSKQTISLKTVEQRHSPGPLSSSSLVRSPEVRARPPRTPQPKKQSATDCSVSPGSKSSMVSEKRKKTKSRKKSGRRKTPTSSSRRSRTALDFPDICEPPLTALETRDFFAKEDKDQHPLPEQLKRVQDKLNKLERAHGKLLNDFELVVKVKDNQIEDLDETVERLVEEDDKEIQLLFEEKEQLQDQLNGLNSAYCRLQNVLEDKNKEIEELAQTVERLVNFEPDSPLNVAKSKKMLQNDTLRTQERLAKQRCLEEEIEGLKETNRQMEEDLKINWQSMHEEGALLVQENKALQVKIKSKDATISHLMETLQTLKQKSSEIDGSKHFREVSPREARRRILPVREQTRRSFSGRVLEPVRQQVRRSVSGGLLSSARGKVQRSASGGLAGRLWNKSTTPSEGSATTKQTDNGGSASSTQEKGLLFMTPCAPPRNFEGTRGGIESEGTVETAIPKPPLFEKTAKLATC